MGFDRVDLTSAASRIVERSAAGERTFVITANPEFVMLARRHAELAHIARSADLVVADGTGVLVASRVLGDPLPGRVPGRLLIAAVLARLPARTPVFFLGAAQGVAERAADAARARWPNIAIAGAYAGTPSSDEDATLRDRISAAADTYGVDSPNC